MLRKTISNQSLGTDRWLSVDPLDSEIIDRLLKKDIREREEKLMLAVLADAIKHFQKYVLARKPSRKLFREAEEWFLDKENEALYSFENICDTLGFHPDHIRRGLMTWRDAKRKVTSLQPTTNRPTKLIRKRHISRPSRLAKAG
jgi:hypothetical protein